jgi:formamidopyrimidine-DNA glycosylase
MPELPDVEGYRRLLEAAEGRRVRRVRAADAAVLRNTTPSGLGRALHGRRFRRPERRGKWLLARTSASTVLLHFGMTGELRWREGGTDQHRHDRLVVETDDGALVYRDQRKLQGVWLARDDRDVDRIIGPQGPDALGLSRRDLDRAFAGRRGGLKATLMDQEVVAGLGNLLTDEILWRARLHPTRRVDELSDNERRRLHRVLQSVLQASAREGRVPARRSWLTGARDLEKPTCPRCHELLRSCRAGGRRSLWCPRCQPP